MLIPLDVERVIETRICELLSVRDALIKAVAKAPKGKIHIDNSGNHPNYYYRANASDVGGKYIRKSRQKEIKVLLQKSYNEKAIKQIESELNVLQILLQKYAGKEEELRRLYEKFPEESQRMISPVDVLDERYMKHWLEEKYQGKGHSSNDPEYITNKGERVRSKSEINIANALERNGIPYKYECPFILKGGNVIYPDFTILHVKKRKVIYWEHRGMMDNCDYVMHSVLRIKEYESNQIYLGDRLIITEEYSTKPLGTAEIQRVINHYLK